MIDDGLGFDLEVASQGGGVGLRGIRERVQKLDGSLEIESSSGHGTRLAIEIPISHWNLEGLDEQDRR
jgi:signal transduction histidine kinase